MPLSVVAEAFGEPRAPDVLVGRVSQLRALLQILHPESHLSMAYVHGSAGIGKSALLRALGDAATADGYSVVAIDGREVAADTATLDEALRPIGALPRPLLVIDTYEDLASLGSHLRQRVLPALPSDARVVVASRMAPETAWLQGVWGQSMLVLGVERLDGSEANELLAARGIDDPILRLALVEWADGLPLALSLGASAAAATAGTVEVSELDGALLDHLTGEQLAGADRDVLSVAAIAPAVDERLLAAVLPEVDGREAETWLRGVSFSEPLGLRATLHSRVRSLIQAELKRHEPAYERALRLRIVDHLAQRSSVAEPHLIGELRELAEVPEDQGVVLGDARTLYRIDAVGPGDAEAVAAAAAGLSPDYVGWLVHWMQDAPEHVFLVRRAEQIVAVDVWATPHRAPAWAEKDPVLTSALTHAALQTPDGNALLHLTRLMLGELSEHAAVFLTANVALILRSGLPNMRRWYTHVLPDDDAAIARHIACDSLREPGLDARIGATEVWGFTLDCGLGGLIGMTQDRAHVLHGSEVSGVTTQLTRREATPELVRRALRTFHQPLALADSPLAFGRDNITRSESVRQLLAEALAGSFGSSDEERLQRSVIELGYFDPEVGHATAMRRLHLSRTTYYRRLREATERLTAFLRGDTP